MWTKIDESLPYHRKVCRLAMDLAISRAAAVGYLACMWLWARANCDVERGRLHVRDGPLLEDAIYWDGERAALIKAMCKVGFLHRDGQYLVVHEWAEHEGKLFAEGRAATERMRELRKQNKARSTTPLDAAFAERSPNVRNRIQGQDRQERRSSSIERLPEESVEECQSSIEEAVKILHSIPGFQVDAGTHALVLAVLSEDPGADIVERARALERRVREHGAGNQDLKELFRRCNPDASPPATRDGSRHAHRCDPRPRLSGGPERLGEIATRLEEDLKNHPGIASRAS